MNPKINYYYYRFFIIFVLVTGILALVFINYFKKTKEVEYFNENIIALDISYNASIDKFKSLTKYILEESIKNEKILNLFKKGLTSEGDERALYKGLLYKELYPLNIKLKNEGIRQLHFHTKNNKSYLRFHKPNKYGDDLSKQRESVKVANEKKKIVTSFETGNIMSGFRNVFPLYLEDKHLGSVEISISTKRMIKSISELDKRREYSLLLNKNIVFKKLFKNQKFLYSPSVINSDFLIEDKDSVLPDSPEKLSSIIEKINLKLHNNININEAMTHGLKYGTFVKVDSIYYDVTFIPMFGVNKKVEGYLVGYEESLQIPFIVFFEIYSYILIILGMIVIISMLILIHRKTKVLENEKKWFKLITDSLGEGLFVMDSKAKINYINPVACEILGYKEKEVLGKNAHNLFHSHSLNNNIKKEDCPIFNAVLENKSYLSKKEYFLNSKGESIPISLHSTLILNTSNEVEIITSFRDITRQNKLEEKSSLLGKALNASINCVVITNKDGVVQWANPAFEKLTGFKINEVIGKNPKEFISSKKQSKEFYSQMWKTILNKKPWKGELVNKKKDGTLYDEELIITPVLDENKEIINFIAVKQDITHRKLLQLEKEEQDKLFFQKSKMAAMGEMLGNIAHQWRQPLSIISTAASGIKLQKEMKLLNDDNFNYAMDSITQSSQYLSETIEDFSGFFDSKDNKKKELSISKTIEKALNIVSVQFASKDIEIIKNLSEIRIVSYENEIIEVLLSILNNAKDALLKIEKGRKIIFINTFIEDNIVVIEIKDNGRGISKEIIDRIFEPYFTTKHQSQGTGVGLYICQDIIINQLKGTLDVCTEDYIYEDVKYTGAKLTIKI